MNELIPYAINMDIIVNGIKLILTLIVFIIFFINKQFQEFYQQILLLQDKDFYLQISIFFLHLLT